MINFSSVPTPFFLEANRFRQRLTEVKQKVIESLHAFRFAHYTPHISKYLGDAFAQGASFVSTTFPKPPVGKPKQKKRKYEDEAESVEGQSEDDVKYWEIDQVYMEARDARTGTHYVFVKWKGFPLTDAQWISVNRLAPKTAADWKLSLELLFPLMHRFDDFPFLDLTD